MVFRISIGLTALLGALILIWVIVAVIWPSKEGELDNKPEWSVLQVVEATHRSERLDQVQLIDGFQGSEFDVVGLPAKDGSVLWLLTNSAGIPQIKTMGGSGPFRISDADYNRIRSSLELNDDVDFLLKNAIELQ